MHKHAILYLYPSIFQKEIFNHFLNWASLMAQVVKNLPAMWETWVWSLGCEDWKIVNLQCCVSFRCTAKWISYIHTYIFSHRFKEIKKKQIWVKNSTQTFPLRPSTVMSLVYTKIHCNCKLERFQNFWENKRWEG